MAPGTPGSAGLGDSFYPMLGNGGYDVSHYHIELDIDPSDNTIEAVTTITATATQRLSAFNLDFSGLTIAAVTVDGADATYVRVGSEMTTTPVSPLAENSEFIVVVSYSGSPEPLDDPAVSDFGKAGWNYRSDPVLIYVASEPSGAMTWFPSNNHPLDKATFQFTLTVPDTTTAAATGTRSSEATADGKTTTVWLEDDPMATYLAAVYVGDFERRVEPGDDVPMIRNYVHADTADEKADKLSVTAGAIDFMEALLGPYPFDVYGSIVMPFDLGHALENQSLSLHGEDKLDPGVIAHEAAHQWFGNSSSLEDWGDIWLNEGFATYLHKMYEVERQGRDLDHEMDNVRSGVVVYHNFFGGVPAPKRVTVEEMFDSGGVYSRGALTLHALRKQVGDTTFFSILRATYERAAGAHMSTAYFLDLVGEFADQDAVDVVNDFLYSVRVSRMPEPDRTAPELSTAVALGSQVRLAFNEDLDESSVPSNSDFTVTVSGNQATLDSEPAVSGPAVTLHLATPITGSDKTITDSLVVIVFADIADTFTADVIWLAQQGITAGCDSHRYCPDEPVTRGQMAAFLHRALDLPAAQHDPFDDDNDARFQDVINRLAQQGITTGCGTRRYCPDEPVTRGQMAAFLHRAEDLITAARSRTA